MSNIEKTKKSVVETVTERVNQLQELGQLHLPKDYSASNAVRAAWLVLQEQKNRDNKPILSLATNESVVSAMFNMVISGLSVAKKQGDFILYGNKLTFQREYHGNKALAKRFGGAIDITHNTVFEGDVFEYVIDKHGRKQITKHEQKIQNIDMDKIVGAYAIVTYKDGETTQAEVMTMKQIKQSWMQGATKGQSPAHRNFPDRMAEKTVANRLLTSIINASDDSALLEDVQTEDSSGRVTQPSEQKSSEVKTITFDEAVEVHDEPEPEPEQEEEPPKKAEKKPVEKEKEEKEPEAPKEQKKAPKQAETLFDDSEEQPF
jgi:recombination protein RecT